MASTPAKRPAIGDDTDSIKAFGLDVVTELCARLLEAGAPGLHFYCMNMAGATCTIVERLGLPTVVQPDPPIKHPA